MKLFRMAIPRYKNVRDFTKKHLGLVEMERQAEIDEQKELVGSMTPEQLEQAGIYMRKMVMVSQAASLFGRTVCSFQPYWMGKENSASKAGKVILSNSVLSTGDIVGLCQAPALGKTLISGVVTQVNEGKLDIAFDSLDSREDNVEIDFDHLFDIVKLAPDITYRRLKSGLEYLQGLDHPLVEIFFQQRPALRPQGSAERIEDREQDLKGHGLNSSQTHAIANAMAQPEVAIIHGPPGTGKTTTLAEFISRQIEKGVKVLACAPSNVAVDNLAEKLLDKGVKNLVRLGHPARVLPRLQSCCLDAVINSSDIMEVCDDIKKEISEHTGRLMKSRDKNEKWRLRGILKELRKDLTIRQKRATSEAIQGASIVLSTLTSLSTEEGVLARNVKEDQFGLVVIDECSQALEAACWLALPFARKCVLAGDHLQLPATIVSEKY